jgi:hypothetical protein
MTRFISGLLLLAALCGIRAPLDTLVDRDHGLPAGYAPGPHLGAQLAMERMMEAAAAEGVLFDVVNGYRSYELQASLFAENPSNRAMPGYSEHQLGTAFDVAWPGKAAYWIGQNEVVWEWLEANAHRFGFVISYPYKECGSWPYNNAFMGACGVDFKREGWHVRYVGRRLAREIYEAGYLDPRTPVTPQDFYRPFPYWLERYYDNAALDGDNPDAGITPLRRWPRGW